MKATENAYAKLNLILKVHLRRPDGFHDITSLMHSVDLCDALSIESVENGKGKISILVDSKDTVPTNGSNLACVAAKLYLERAAISDSINITISKKIPVSAGLAGGSSDAAAVLRALNKIYSAFSSEELLTLGAEIGSDVPFCIKGGTAICEGRGEKITPVVDFPNLHFAIAIGSSRVSTMLAFASLDEYRENIGYNSFTCANDPLNNLFFALSDHSNSEANNFSPLAISSWLSNDFEDIVINELSEVKLMKDILSSYGAVGTLMSGSGPSVFGIFESKTEAENAILILKKNGFNGFYCRSTGDSFPCCIKNV